MLIEYMERKNINKTARMHINEYICVLLAIACTNQEKKYEKTFLSGFRYVGAYAGVFL